MKVGTGTLMAAGLGISLAACTVKYGGGGNESPEPGPAPTTSSQEGATASVRRVNLIPLGNSGIGGEVSLTPRSSQTNVVLTVQLPADSGNRARSYAADIHLGTCAQLGQVAALLQDVRSNGSGEGTSVTAVNIPLANLTNGRHTIAIHDRSANPSQAIACADLR